MDGRVIEAIEAGDLNALLRVVDGFAHARDWDALIELAERCEDALERGKQLWPIAAHVDYRLALEAPGEIAASVLHPDVGRFAFGPLTEVAASTHSWDELAPYIEGPQVAAYVAQERVIRGERLTGRQDAEPDVLHLPLELQGWEPSYALATYSSDHVEIAEPFEPPRSMSSTDIVDADELDEPELVETLLDLVSPWTAESNGAARAAVVEGTAAAAASRLTYAALRMGELEPRDAVQRIGWAAASGGAHGRRRGAALGRFMAWNVAAMLLEVAWPPPPAELEAGLPALRWFRWDEGEPEKGWVLRLAVEDPDAGWAAAIAATDLLEEKLD
jgi:hypothetical protein